MILEEIEIIGAGKLVQYRAKSFSSTHHEPNQLPRVIPPSSGGLTRIFLLHPPGGVPSPSISPPPECSAELWAPSSVILFSMVFGGQWQKFFYVAWQ
jgi:hypothetical protein